MTENEYIYLYDDPIVQLAAIKAIIIALDLATADIVSKGAIKEYSLDDGQVRIQRTYGTLKEIVASRLFYTQEANRLLAQINGRGTKIIPCLG